MAQFIQVIKFSLRPFLLAWVVSTLDSVISWINHYPADNIIHFLNNWGHMFRVTSLQS